MKHQLNVLTHIVPSTTVEISFHVRTWTKAAYYFHHFFLMDKKETHGIQWSLTHRLEALNSADDIIVKVVKALRPICLLIDHFTSNLFQRSNPRRYIKSACNTKICWYNKVFLFISHLHVCNYQLWPFHGRSVHWHILKHTWKLKYVEYSSQTGQIKNVTKTEVIRLNRRVWVFHL